MAETKEKSTGGANKNAGSVSNVTDSVKIGSNKAAENVKSGAGKSGGNSGLFREKNLECGAASLTMVMHYYRKFIPLEQARVDCGVSRDGANAKNIILAARSYGMEAKAWRVDPEDLIEEGPFPCIIHWGFNHFVVLCGFRRAAAVSPAARSSVS